jgi:mRNA m6A methyltransferase catalytic subunit
MPVCHNDSPRLVDDIAWVKSTVNRRLAKGHGYYLQHAKETCLVGRRKVYGRGESCRGREREWRERERVVCSPLVVDSCCSRHVLSFDPFLYCDRLTRTQGSTAVVHGDIGSDVIFAQRRGQSQKPEEIYELVEKLVPNGR